MSDLPAGMLAGCDRFVRADVEPGERARQSRLIGALLAAPFVAGPVMALSFAAGGSALALSLLCSVLAVSWALALVVALTGARAPVEVAGLVLATIGIALASAGGGLPVLTLSACLAFEAWWVGRTRAALAVGAAVAVAAFPAAQIVQHLTDAQSVASAANPWLWLAPLALGASAGVRVAFINRQPREEAVADKFDPVVERLSLAMVRLTASGEVTTISGAAASALGLPRETLVGRMLLERVHVADRVAFLTALHDCVPGDAPTHLPLRLRVTMAGRPGDRFQPFSAQICRENDTVLLALRQDDGGDLGERLARAEERAESLEIAKGRFLAAVSHELRTPLNSIIGFSDMLLHGMAGPLAEGRQGEYVGLIRDSGSHLLSVVNAILDVSKIESGAYSIHAEPFTVAEAVELCHSMLTPQADARDITFLVRTRADVGSIVADRRAVQQIIINLAANAIKFTPAGGKVSVEAMRSGSWLRLVVSDTGIGMSEDDLARVGRPFMQVQNELTRQYEGTGLGLSLVKGLVRLHDGEMTIESAPGEGTLVTVALPLAGPRTAREQPAEANGGADEAIRKIA